MTRRIRRIVGIFGVVVYRVFVVVVRSISFRSFTGAFWGGAFGAPLLRSILLVGLGRCK